LLTASISRLGLGEIRKNPEADASGELVWFMSLGCSHRAPSSYPFPVVQFSVASFQFSEVWKLKTGN
jgi:hypothetical protein